MRNDEEQKPNNKAKQQTRSPQNVQRNPTKQGAPQDKGGKGTQDKSTPTRSDDPNQNRYH